MKKRKLRALTFLAPNMFPVYQFMIRHLGSSLGCEIELEVGYDYDKVLDSDLAFICGLPYVLYTSPYLVPSRIEALVAPVLQSDRFQNQPIYYSDVIVHRDSQFNSFKSLRGCSWAYNEPLSQSGYGIIRYYLLQMGETDGFFGEVIEAGFHEKSIELVCNREIDASAIDAHVLAIELHRHPELAEQIRVIGSLGPSTIQPLAVASHLPKSLKQDIQDVFTELHHDPDGRGYLDLGLIDHFVRMSDSDYDDIRKMLLICEQAGFMSLG
jgi:phosphonate transport system substrate-binding protein